MSLALKVCNRNCEQVKGPSTQLFLAMAKDPLSFPAQVQKQLAGLTGAILSFHMCGLNSATIVDAKISLIPTQNQFKSKDVVWYPAAPVHSE